MLAVLSLEALLQIEQPWLGQWLLWLSVLVKEGFLLLVFLREIHPYIKPKPIQYRPERRDIEQQASLRQWICLKLVPHRQAGSLQSTGKAHSDPSVCLLGLQ